MVPVDSEQDVCATTARKYDTVSTELRLVYALTYSGMPEPLIFDVVAQKHTFPKYTSQMRHFGWRVTE